MSWASVPRCLENKLLAWTGWVESRDAETNLCAAGMRAMLSACLSCCPLLRLVAESALTWDRAFWRAMLNAGLLYWGHKLLCSNNFGTPQLTSHRFGRDAEVPVSIQILQVGLKSRAPRGARLRLTFQDLSKETVSEEWHSSDWLQ